MRSSVLAAAGACLCAAAIALGAIGGTASNFTSSATNTGSTFSAATVNQAPEVARSVIARNVSASGSLTRSAKFYVYAQATDDSAVSTVKATLTNITGSSTAVSLVAGSWTVAGATYNYRSAQLTASSSLSGSSKTYTVTATDAKSLTDTFDGTVAVDTTSPQPSSIVTTNRSGGTAGRAEQGDSITYTYNEAIDPESILAGWNGASTDVQVGIIDSSSDYVQVYAPSATNPDTPTNLGKVDLSQGGFTNSGYAVFGLTSADNTPSTMVMSNANKTITVTFGSLDYGSVNTVNNFATERWTPVAATLDLAGNAVVTSTITAGGGSHKAL